MTGIIPGITKSLNESGDFDGVIPIVRQGSFESSQGDKILEVRVVTSASLVGGNKYKTIKVDDYRNYYKELAFKKVKMPGGAEIDFDDVRTFKDIKADELKSYVEYEKSYLEGEMERTFREDFADYSKTELNDRISKELNEATGKYIAGEAMKDAPAHRKSIVPGAPDITTVGRIAATIGASFVPGVGPLLALAVQGAFTALDKHDGYIASWRQAGLQFGIAAATTYLTAGMGSGIGSTITRTAINTATSGIDYKSNGSIGWSNDKFRAGIKSSVVNGAISYGLSSFNVGGSGAFGNALRAGITSFANSTLDFSEDGWKIGIRNDNNWGDRFASGIAAGAASAVTSRLAGKDESGDAVGTERSAFTTGITTDEYLGHLAYNTINSGLLSVYNMARYDMSWSQASTTTGFYSGMNYSVSELGGFAGQVLSEGTGRAAIGRQKDEEARKKAEAEAAKNKSGQNVPPSSAGEGFVNALGAGLIRIKNDLKDLWDGLTNFGERLGNLITGEGFNTDREIINARIKGAIASGNSMEYGTDAYYQAKAAMHDVKITESKGVKTITETSDDGMTKKTTVMSEKDGMYQEREESYATIDGKKVRQKEVIVETYNDTSCMQVKLYDKSGKDAYREDGYTLDENGNYQLSYVDVKILEQTGNNAGNVFKGDKQWKYNNPRENAINNDLPTNAAKDPKILEMEKVKTSGIAYASQNGKPIDIKFETTVTDKVFIPDGKGYKDINMISTQGCFLTMLADHLTYETGRKYTPQDMNVMGDAKGAYTGMMTNYEIILGGTDYELVSQKLSELFTIEDMQGKIEERLSASQPTGIQVGTGDTHFLSITGARYDAGGNVTKYYTSDPGTANSNYDYIEKSTMQYTPDVKNRRWSPRKVERIMYMTKSKVEGE